VVFVVPAGGFGDGFTGAGTTEGVVFVAPGTVFVTAGTV